MPDYETLDVIRRSELETLRGSIPDATIEMAMEIGLTAADLIAKAGDSSSPPDEKK